jgi:hypothetical protein
MNSKRAILKKYVGSGGPAIGAIGSSVRNMVTGKTPFQKGPSMPTPVSPSTNNRSVKVDNNAFPMPKSQPNTLNKLPKLQQLPQMRNMIQMPKILHNNTVPVIPNFKGLNPNKLA